MKKSHIFTFSILSLLTLSAVSFAINNKQIVDVSNAATDDYYKDVDTSTKDSLYTSLHNIISSRTYCSYEGLIAKLQTSDFDVDGIDNPESKNRMVDIYSNFTYFAKDDCSKNYTKEGDTWNREHLIPQSWWGGGETGPNGEGGDAFNMYPTDGFINGQRGNIPFGETKNPSYVSENGFSKKGPSSFDGYSGTVFEVNDKYKGDVARAYFYFATKNNNYATYTQAEGNAIFSGTSKFGLTEYAKKLFLKWHELDPVSDWEKLRCDRVYALQNNRNPFIDHPEWATYIFDSVTPPHEDGIKVNAIAFRESKLNLNVNSTKEINATVYPINAENKTLAWSSDDESIATVKDGVVKGISVGKCNITCTAKDGSGISNSLKVSVYSESTLIPDNDNIVISKTKCPTVGDYAWYDIKSTGLKDPVGKMFCFSDVSKNYLQFNTSKDGYGVFTNVPLNGLKSIDISLANDSNNVTFTLKASNTPYNTSNFLEGTSVGTQLVNAGQSATLTPTSDVKSYTYYSLYVDKLARVSNINFTFGEGYKEPEVVKVTGLSLSTSSLNMKKGDKTTVVASILPNNAPNDGFTFTSKNTNVVTVNNAGLVTAVGNGNTTIVVGVRNTVFAKEFTVNVTTPLISLAFDCDGYGVDVGDTIQSTITINPVDTTEPDVVYSSSDDSIATVTSAGLITGIKKGNCTVTVKSATHDNIFATCEITVSEIPVPPASNTLVIVLAICIPTVSLLVIGGVSFILIRKNRKK